MTFRPDHELHKRRFGRNVGLGLVLISFVVLMFGLTIVKTMEHGVSALPHAEGDG